MTIYPAGRRRRRPTHPGEVLREDILPAMRINVSEAARALGVSRQMLHKLLAGDAAVTPEMALRLGKFCGDGPEVWINMQIAVDLWDAQERVGDQIAAIATRSAA